MLKILPIVLFSYARGSAYYSSMPADYSNLIASHFAPENQHKSQKGLHAVS